MAILLNLVKLERIAQDARTGDVIEKLCVACAPGGADGLSK